MINLRQRTSAKVTAVILAVMMVVTFMAVDTSAFVFAGTNGGVQSAEEVDVMVPLSDDTNIEVIIPVAGITKDALEEAINNDEIDLSLDRDKSKPYLEEDMFPKQKDGGALDTWMTQNNTPIFTDIVLTAVDSNGAPGLKITMKSNCYFYSRGKVDYSAPHTGGGAYLDICGYFNLNAAKDGTNLGAATAKVTPYVNFHTMDEVYADIDKMAAMNTTRYVSKRSMGHSTAGRDMPYLIIAKDAKTVIDWLDYCDLVENDPEAALLKIKAGDTANLRVPVLYSNIHSNEVAATDGILDFAWKLIEEDTIPYKYLDGFTADGQAQYEQEMGPKGQAGSTAVPDLIKNTATYLGWLRAGNSASGKVDMEKYYNMSDKEYKVDDILEDVFFIIVPEENVDGRAQDTREAANGFDLNRDNSFQVTPETANMQQMIGQFNPVSVTEFHGRVNAFQCEPCDPPHEPNFEYDLLAEHLIPGGEAIGNVAVANNPSYNSYVIPQRDYLLYTGEGEETYWDDPWDDMSTSYTPQYAMLHGAVAYTVELPAYSYDSTQLVSYGIIGNSAYVAQEKDGYLQAQAMIYKRGVNNENSDAFDQVGQWLCDQYDVEGAESELFRPEYIGEGENGNFYPEAYIIPVDRDNQKNLQAAKDMVLYLARNDVKVCQATGEFKIGDVTYPAGTIIVPMHQAKRSVANGVLNDGTMIHSWTVLYSEGITAFNKTRGFDMAVTAKTADYDVLKGVMGDPFDYNAAEAFVYQFGSSFDGVKGADVIIRNVSEDSTYAVNVMLQSGMTVGMVTEGEFKGDFIVKYDDFLQFSDIFSLTAIGVDDEDSAIKAKVISPSKVYIVGRQGDANAGFIGTNRVTSGSYVYNYDRYAMDILNFEVTDKVSKADVIIGGMAIGRDSKAAAVTSAIQEGVPYITYTSNAGANLQAIGVDAARTGLSGAMDCLGYVTYPEATMTNATYINEGDDIMYGYNAGFFSKVPEGAKILVKTDKTKEPLEGFIPLNSKPRETAYQTYRDEAVLGFEYAKDGLDIAAFSQTLTNKVHQRDEYQFISNFIFSRNLGEDYVGAKTTPEKPAKVTLKSVKKGKKQITVTWKRVAKNTTSYEISLTNSKGKKQIVTVKQGKKSTMKKVIKVKKGTYKVKVRAVNTNENVGKVSYGAWSKTKKVTVK